MGLLIAILLIILAFLVGSQLYYRLYPHPEKSQEVVYQDGDKYVVDLNKNLQYRITGLYGKGYIEIVSNKLDGSEDDPNIQKLQDSLTYTIDNNHKLKSGDKTSIFIHFDEKLAAQYHIQVKVSPIDIQVGKLHGEKIDTISEEIEYTVKGEKKKKIVSHQVIDGVVIPDVYRDNPDAILAYFRFLECKDANPETFNEVCKMEIK